MFDSGATHSFISYACARKLGLKIDNLPYELSVCTPTGIQVSTFHVCPNCEIQFGKTCTTLSFVCLSMSDIDIIIGMDWLSSNHVLLDCFQKTVSLPIDFDKIETSSKGFYLNATQIEDYSGGNVRVL